MDESFNRDLMPDMVWWCVVGLNVGVEVSGKSGKFTRPVLVLKKFDKRSFLGIPLTSRDKEGSWYAPVRYTKEKSVAMLAQIKVFDSGRLIDKIGTLGNENVEEIKNALSGLYGLTNICPATEGGGIVGNPKH